MKLLISLFLLFSTVSYSLDPSFSFVTQNKEAITSCMRAIEDKKIYSRGYCHLNIHTLVHYLNERNFDINKTKVIFITGKQSYIDPIYGIINRMHERKKWRFHVVLESDNKIYDFDYTRLIEVEEKEVYYDNMFHALDNRNEMQEIYIREIPAQTYLETLKLPSNLLEKIFLKAWLRSENGKVVKDQFINDFWGKYPRYPIKDYLGI